MALDPCGGDGALRRSLAPFGIDVRLSDLYPEKYPADGYVSREPLNACDPEHLRSSLEQAGIDCRAIVTNTPHNTFEARAIVSNLIALVEGQHVDLVATLFRSIWGSEPGRLAYLNRPSFYGEIACCWRCRWIEGSTGSPMHAYSWYIWRKAPRYGPSLKGRIGQRETVSALSAVNLPNTPLTAETKPLQTGDAQRDAVAIAAKQERRGRAAQGRARRAPHERAARAL